MARLDDGRRPRPPVFGLSRRISGECLERLDLLTFNFSIPLEICDLISGADGHMVAEILQQNNFCLFIFEIKNVIRL